MRKLIQCVQNENKETTIIETIHAIKNAGFDGVFVQWYDKDFEISQQAQVDLCRELGLEIEFAHLGYGNINSLWYEEEQGDLEIENYIQNLRDMKKNNIDKVVMHLMNGKNFPPLSEIGLKRIRKVVDVAEELGIKIAFENTRSYEFLEYVFKNIESENIGICLDTGHYHCHFKDKFNWDFFKDKIIALHIHDNFGEIDQHLLPFDGSLDWNDVSQKIMDSGYDGPVTLESCYRRKYLDISVDEFYKNSYETAKKVRELFDSKKN